MGRVFHSYYTRPRADGKPGREKVTSKKWCAEWTAADGSTKRKTIGLDKRAAEMFLARRIEEVERERAGLGAPVDSSPARLPILDLLEQFLDHLRNNGNVEAGLKTIRQQVSDCARACGWQTWTDVNQTAVEKFLRSLRETGRGPSTSNHYLRNLKGFAKWFCERIEVVSPLRKIKQANVDVDRRRSKVILTDSQLAKLIAAAQTSPSRYNTVIHGPDRAMLYRVAAYTGLRVSELASLMPESFDLASKPPRVSPAARDQKAKRPDVIPIPAVILGALRAWLKGKPRGKRLWPGTWAQQKVQADWIARDLRRAGIGERGPKGQQLDPTGKAYHFHGLRRGFVTRLIRSGADVDEVRRLARHKDVQTTLDSYASTDLERLGRAADKLKKLPRV